MAHAADEIEAVPERRLVFRHRLSTRIWHWTNALTVFVLLMSGLMIFNAHPRLYWGQYGANWDRAWLEIGSTQAEGYLKIGNRRWETTGVLGRWENAEGVTQRRAFPYWATIPSTYSLALARRWHLSFAWLLGLGLGAFLVRAFWNRHVSKDLSFTREELKPAAIWRDLKDHLRLKFHHSGESALRYNLLQKASYVGVIFVLLPLLIFTGLAMSPGMNAAWPWLIDIFAGRQSARSIHFIAAALIVGFIVIHLIAVVLAGPINEIRSMVTGWFRVPEERP